MKAVPLAGLYFISLPRSYRLEVQENTNSSWGSFQPLALCQGHYSGDTIHKFCIPLRARVLAATVLS